MRTSEQKFFEILARYGLSAELETTPVAANRVTLDGHSKVTFYGVGQPISPEVAEAIRAEVFPFIAAEKPDFGAQNDEAIISDEVLPLGGPARQAAGFAVHCALYDRGK